MDLRYTTALRNATHAWSNNRTTDAITMQDLQRRAQSEQQNTAHEATAHKAATTLNATQMGILQPELARYGNLGTKLNLFA